MYLLKSFQAPQHLHGAPEHIQQGPNTGADPATMLTVVALFITIPPTITAGVGGTGIAANLASTSDSRSFH